MTRRKKAVAGVMALAVLCAAAAMALLPLTSEKGRAKSLAGELYSENADVVERAQKRLADMGAAAVPALMEVVRDSMKERWEPWEWVRRHALGRAGTNAWLRALNTLVIIGEPAVPTLEQALGDSSEQIRYLAADTLCCINGPSADEAWVRALDSPFEDVRWRAALIRGSAGDARAVPALIPELQSDNSRQRWTAALLLQIIGTREALAALEDVAARFRTYEIAANYREVILAGDQAGVLLLIFCLERYGTEEMAADYARSRQVQLEHAADAWATRRGRTLALEANDSATIVWGAAKRQ